ncbi:MAG: hypothetical protein QM751_13920 [Paludibacteraceae bacterium]
MKPQHNKQAAKFPVKEGEEQGSILAGSPSSGHNRYPQPLLKDRQNKNQTEFIEEQPNRKSKK